MTLLERIDWVLEHRKDRVKNSSQWSLRAGLTRQHIATIRDRLKANPDSDQGRGTLEALAAAAGVSPAWLSHGRGSPDDEPSTQAQERYTAMPAIREMARLEGYAPEFIENFEALLDLDEQPSA